MRRVLITALAAASISAMASSPAQAVTVIGDTFAVGGTHAGQDCPLQASFSSCWITVNGTTNTQPTDPTASRVVAAMSGSGVLSDVSTFYNTITQDDFTVSLSASNLLSFTYNMDANDPILHYITIKQAGGGASDGGYQIFYDAAGFTSGTTYTFDLSAGHYFDQAGLSHLTVWDSVAGVPEPATWAMMLLGFGGIGMAMRRRRSKDGRLPQVA